MGKSWGRYAIVAFAIPLCSAAALLLAAHAVVSDPVHIEATRRAFERVTGLQIATTGPVDIDVFPRPRIIAKGLTITIPGGVAALDVPVLRASLALFPLLRGRFVLDTVQLLNPTGFADVDALGFRWRHRAANQNTPEIADEVSPPDKITVASGILQIRSANPAKRGIVTDLHGDLEGFSSTGTTLAGGAVWHGERGDVSARLDSLASFVDGRPTKASVKLRSRLLAASLAGTFADGWQGRFNGKLALSSPSLPALLRVSGIPVASSIEVQHAGLEGDAEATGDDIALANARLTLNDTSLEGTLAWQQSGGRSGLAGTLATDLLKLGPLVSALPPLRDADGQWSARAIDASFFGAHDVDLRISANRLTLGGVETEDAALSVLCQSGRMEVSLGEAKAYGGLVKARLFASGADNDLDVKVDASWSRVNLDAMAGVFAKAPGQIKGYATGHLTAGGHGRTISDILRSTDGHGQISLRQAKIEGLPVVDALMHPDSGANTDEASAADMPIDLASAEFEITRGLLTIGHASVAGPDLHLGIRGQTSLSKQSYILSSTSNDPSPTPDGAPATVSSNFGGLWGGPIRRLEPDRSKDRDLPPAIDAPRGDYFP